jgi:type III secretory pathway component EscV
VFLELEIARDGKVICALVDETLEVRIAEQASRGVAAEDARGIVETIVAGVAGDDGAVLDPIVLVGAAIRRTLRDLVSVELPRLRVIAYEELVGSTDETAVIPLVTIALAVTGDSAAIPP